MGSAVRPRYGSHVDEQSVVTVFLLRHDPVRVLLGRRSAQVRTYPGVWGGISGYVEGDAIEQAWREVAEETGLPAADVRFVRAGEVVVVDDISTGARWQVRPFLFEALRPDAVRIDWEHDEFAWTAPDEIEALETVPKLLEALRAVYP